jgi:hypothetical protein
MVFPPRGGVFNLYDKSSSNKGSVGSDVKEIIQWDCQIPPICGNMLVLCLAYPGSLSSRSGASSGGGGVVVGGRGGRCGAGSKGEEEEDTEDEGGTPRGGKGREATEQPAGALMRGGGMVRGDTRQRCYNKK